MSSGLDLVKGIKLFSALLWTVLLIYLGSVTACFYILLQFLKLSPQESSQDPIYHVLLQHSSKDGVEQKKQHFPVIIARIAFIVLGGLMLATLLYTIFTDGSPFWKELLTPVIKLFSTSWEE
ncbi:uncharacterized protein LOC104439253 isoform X2 [Eucalyptus grandis]|uniref:uncharacterized protein LOC104439253 isoform X2 n=1 Tax=Eucalyptus grandis TaxID=71139 RepID=UPI00192EA454|nr:uncharacterized protein LOC104439253 isoform X2 [Eucalyptus grandis]